jgi:hypothetical protein
MDAVTSFELEAQRRRETVAGDRGMSRWQIEASTELAEGAIFPALVERSRRGERAVSPGECQPNKLARTSVG